MQSNIKQIMYKTQYVTEGQVRGILRSSLHSAESLAIVAILDLLNGDLTIEELRTEVGIS